MRLIYHLLLAAPLISAPVSSPHTIVRAESVRVTGVKYQDRTLNILQALAERYHVVISVSGTLIGPDNKVIQISVVEGTLREVFDQIVRDDARFQWHQGEDGAADFRTINSPLTLVDVLISSLEINDPPRSTFPSFLTSVPEVNEWRESHNCFVQEIIFGRPSGNWRKFSLLIKDQSFGAAMDQIAEKSGSYFWSAILYSTNPCTINLAP